VKLVCGAIGVNDGTCKLRTLWSFCYANWDRGVALELLAHDHPENEGRSNLYEVSIFRILVLP
jgi:hypothetical protein